ncbi:MAG TPA: S41 family peptidase [Thermoanaerobaculia bacterium]|jgi:C-terminal processing protease CtpA/Prc
MTPFRLLLPALVLLLLTPAASAATTTERLASLARAWGLVKYAHPYLGSTDVDWDRAGVRAIERTLTAGSADAFAAAAQEMFAALGDPATRVMMPCTDGAPGAPPQSEQVTIVDLRQCAPVDLTAIAPSLIRGTIDAPAQRKVAHNGYKSHEPVWGEGSIYNSSYVIQPGASFTGTATTARPVVFVVDEHSTLPEVAKAMVLAGQASIISVGPYRDLGMTWKTVPLEDGYVARIRTSDPMTAIVPRTVLSGDASDAAIVAAAEEPPPVLRRRAVRGPATTSVTYTWRRDDAFVGMPYPDAAHRLLAAFRYWNVIHFFYPYKHLMDAWDPRLEPMLHKLLAASSQTEYELALTEVTTWVPDGHSWSFTDAYIALQGRGAPPFHTYTAEGKVVVTAFTNQSAAVAAGVSIGDELLAIDGRPIEDRLAELRRYISWSTPGTRDMLAAYHSARGANNSEPLMRFRRPDGTEYETRVRRSTAWRLAPEPAVFWKLLPGNIGYVDVGYLRDEDVPQVMQALANTRAIIFDMRGYPRMFTGMLSQWVNVNGPRPFSEIRVPQVIGGDVSQSFRVQNIGPVSANPYRGKTFVLVDERTQSAAEHFGLAMEAGANSTFVGSITSGSNGNVTDIAAPGDNFITFTGMDVRHGDGRQLQRVGIVPHVLVPRTVANIAAGVDEVLEKALELARQP